MSLTAVIDSHAHLGRWHDEPNQFFSAQTLLEGIAIEETAGCTVEGVLVSNLSGIDTIDNQPGSQPLKDQISANAELAEICRTDRRLLPVAVCQPGWGAAGEMSGLLAQERFFALKFHPFYLDIDADDPAYDPYLQLAQQHGLPCVFHAAPGASDPEKIYRLARRFPSVPVVLYHMNLMGDLEWGIQVAKEARQSASADLYLESSWTEPEMVVRAIGEVGIERLLFGSDAPLGPFTDTAAYASRIDELQEAIRDSFSNHDRVLDHFFYANSRRLFRIT